MTGQLSEQEIYEQAKKLVWQKRDFYIHLFVYVIVNAALVVVWAKSGPGFPWFIFPPGFWGIIIILPMAAWATAIVLHFLETFVFNGGTGWERRQIEKEALRLRREQG